MISYYYRSVREDKLSKLENFRTGSWIYAEAPTKEERDLLTEKFGLDADLLGDALDPDEIPRSEAEGEVV